VRHRLGLATRTQISVCKLPFPSAGTAVGTSNIKIMITTSPVQVAMRYKIMLFSVVLVKLVYDTQYMFVVQYSTYGIV